MEQPRNSAIQAFVVTALAALAVSEVLAVKGQLK
jgi:hypothetical protein